MTIAAVAASSLTLLVDSPASADPRCPNNDPFIGFCVGGKILEEYNAAGGFGFFGNATSGELNAAGGGRWQPFKRDQNDMGNSIYWNPNVAGGRANQVGGLIRDKWGQTGWETGTLGYPTTRERPTRKPGRFNHFERGSVYYSQATGAKAVYGKIRDYWAQQDWENGALGFPASDEFGENGGRSQNYQGGKVQWFPTLTSQLPAQNTSAYGGYDMDLQIASPPLPGWNPAAVKNEVMQHFDAYFTYTGCGDVVYVGKECVLKTTGAPDGPIRFTHVTNDGFALVSLPNHPEGQDRTISFRFYYATVGTLGQYELRMRVKASGPASAASALGPFNEYTAARKSWQIFQDNLRNRIPNASTRYVPCCGYGDVSTAPNSRSAQSQYPGPVEVKSGDDPVILPGTPIEPLPESAAPVPGSDPNAGQPTGGVPQDPSTPAPSISDAPQDGEVVEPPGPVAPEAPTPTGPTDPEAVTATPSTGANRPAVPSTTASAGG